MQKRINKSKSQILDEIAQKAKIENFKNIGKKLFPMLTTDSIYDAQTVLDALSGYIKMELAVKESSFLVSDLLVDLSNEPKGNITDIMKAIHTEISKENAKDMAEFLELFSKTFSTYAVNQYLKKPMSDLKVEDIIA